MPEDDFKQPALGAFSCAHVVKQGWPILFVSHDQDGDWQFMCGQNSHAEEGHLVHLGHFLDKDPTPHELADLELGWEAERLTSGGAWQRRKSVRHHP